MLVKRGKLKKGGKERKGKEKSESWLEDIDIRPCQSYERFSGTIVVQPFFPRAGSLRLVSSVKLIQIILEILRKLHNRFQVGFCQLYLPFTILLVLIFGK